LLLFNRPGLSRFLAPDEDWLGRNVVLFLAILPIYYWILLLLHHYQSFYTLPTDFTGQKRRFIAFICWIWTFVRIEQPVNVNFFV